MLVEQFEKAVANAKVEPKGVKVSPDLWRELSAAGLIKMRDVADMGVFNLGYQLPFYKDTWLICAPELELRGKDFELPPNAAT